MSMLLWMLTVCMREPKRRRSAKVRSRKQKVWIQDSGDDMHGKQNEEE